ncbi:MAG: phage portal protein [Alistipes sp.]|nr:phage portal protein [Alistipes sp.]MBR6631231.1 phage portal protein [Alistipes sp.]
MKQSVRFAAINPYKEEFIERPVEKVDNRSAFVRWGTNNAYPEYLSMLNKEVSTLASIINGSVDYVVGDDVTLNIPDIPEKNSKGETFKDIVEQMARNYFRYGGWALHVIRSNEGKVVEVEVVDLRYLRSDKENEVFFYSEEWGNRAKYSRYPKFVPDFTDIASSIHYCKNNETQVYPEPLYLGSIKACEIERAIDDYHLNSINNGFMGSYIVNFNNGRPEDTEMDEIVKNINEKFAGVANAGRIAVAFNDSQDTAVTINELKTQDFGEHYNTAAKNARQRIFTSFRANPNLFGIPTESLGFSSEEYESAFKLYNRTQILPVQKKIVDALDYVFSTTGSITITPFSLDYAVKKVE